MQSTTEVTQKKRHQRGKGAPENKPKPREDIEAKIKEIRRREISTKKAASSAGTKQVPFYRNKYALIGLLFAILLLSDSFLDAIEYINRLWAAKEVD